MLLSWAIFAVPSPCRPTWSGRTSSLTRQLTCVAGRNHLSMKRSGLSFCLSLYDRYTAGLFAGTKKSNGKK